MKWPNNKEFAFTIIDDNDNSSINNVKPVYDLLETLGLKTTKTVWVYPSRDRFSGDSISDKKYLDFILHLQDKGFEIALHSVSGGNFTREEIIKGLKFFKEVMGCYPSMNINHAQNLHNLYWGNRSCSKLLQWYAKKKNPNEKSFGEDVTSKFYWGDFVKKHIKYIRSRTFNKINTLANDPRMPYRDKDKNRSSNFWFSSSDGSNVKKFTALIRKENIDKLVSKGGLCIVSTHFASGFVDLDGKVDPDFEKNLRYLASRNGLFVPATQVLDYLLSRKEREYESELYFFMLDIKRKLRRSKDFSDFEG